MLVRDEIGGAGENRTHDRGFADLGLTTWLPRLIVHQNETLKRKALAGAGLQETGAPPLQFLLFLHSVNRLRSYLLRLHYSSGAAVIVA